MMLAYAYAGQRAPSLCSSRHSFFGLLLFYWELWGRTSGTDALRPHGLSRRVSRRLARSGSFWWKTNLGPIFGVGGGKGGGRATVVAVRDRWRLVDRHANSHHNRAPRVIATSGLSALSTFVHHLRKRLGPAPSPHIIHPSAACSEAGMTDVVRRLRPSFIPSCETASWPAHDH
ncbi:uncharacterized protein SCHCODRAFT_02267631 [Schizophyllum commune H4-8]|uniref:uncharacterized protein n=1 Tax=Schizophyllum commune (strain H4-8 / FGSC 9210) TaxID=578458 RepID=UPI00215EBD9E|nr:uncharacterized protein SCHCODRAFT_02267631 [Schizophyllum commune H4-8]KAI5894039.1 hypothetical protein SCHCODRAFT_02267631 [Schizophyllum commune H4-8]